MLHADEDMANFCKGLDNAGLEWLRMAAAFMVTGRECEISPLENINLYQQYRDASAQHFKAFLEDESQLDVLPNCPLHPDSLIHVLQYLGNPSYEVGYNGKPAINACSNEAERTKRNFVFRILTLVHKLDTVRCYGAKQQAHSLEVAKGWVNEGSEQQADFNSLLRYAIELNREHGNNLRCDITVAGALMDIHEDYKAPFDEVSHSIQALDERTAAVSVPNFQTKAREFTPNVSMLGKPSRA
jgi:hypothetical protein